MTKISIDGDAQDRQDIQGVASNRKEESEHLKEACRESKNNERNWGDVEVFENNRPDIPPEVALPD